MCWTAEADGPCSHRRSSASRVAGEADYNPVSSCGSGDDPLVPKRAFNLCEPTSLQHGSNKLGDLLGQVWGDGVAHLRVLRRSVS